MLAFTERAAGERLFVDYAGHMINVIDLQTGEVRPAQRFVAALGAPSYIFAEATWTQTLPDWIASRARLWLLRRCDGADCVRQSEGGGHKGLLL
jgi:transposase